MSATNTTVSNSLYSNNPDFNVRNALNAAGEKIQVFRLDLGSGTTEAIAVAFVSVGVDGISGAGTGLTTFDAGAGPILLNTPIDINLVSQEFTSEGAVYSAGGSQNNTKALAAFQLIDSTYRTIIRRRATTATLTNVSASASSVLLSAANTLKLGATIYNDSTATLYLKFGSTASTTSFTVKIFAEGTYEVPDGYTGRIEGIWASATGAARVTELTA